MAEYPPVLDRMGNRDLRMSRQPCPSMVPSLLELESIRMKGWALNHRDSRIRMS